MFFQSIQAADAAAAAVVCLVRLIFHQTTNISYIGQVIGV